jgi:tetratricopeptide (TPR) repeat protein
MIELAFMLALATGSSQVQEVPAPPACRGAFETIDWQACADASGQGTPGYALAMINLGTRAYVEGDYASALSFYDKAEQPGQSIQSDVIFHTFRGDTYRHTGREAEALADARLAWLMLIEDPSVAGDPRDRRPIDDGLRFFVLVRILGILKTGDAEIFGSARAMFIALPVDSAEDLSNRAGALEQLGEFDAALVDSKRAVDLQPGDPGALNNHCYILIRAGQAERGLPYCERAVALVPEIAPVRHSYASALAALGRCRDADHQLAEARRLDPSGALYRQPLVCTPKP